MAGRGGLGRGGLLVWIRAVALSISPAINCGKALRERSSACAIAMRSSGEGFFKTQFATSDLVDATDINVDVTNGVVKLTGTVSSNQEQREAVRLAQTTEGVRSVDSSGLKLMEDEEKARQDRMKKNRP